jgi:replicative DNA helicase
MDEYFDGNEAHEIDETRKRILMYERTLLGAMMAPGVTITHAMETIDPQHFSDAFFRSVYVAWMERRSTDLTVDLIGVHEALQAHGVVKDSTLSDLVDMVQDAQNTSSGGYTLKSYIQQITDYGKRMALKRKLREALDSVDTSPTYDDAVSSASAALDDTIQEGSGRGVVTASEIAEMGLAFVQDRVDGKFAGLSTGIPDLDDLMYGGLRGGELVTLFGPPKGGKTTAATTILENIALSEAKPVVLVFSREMGEIQLAVRHFASLGGASAKNILTGKLRDDDYDGIAAAVGRISDMRIVYDLDSSKPSQIALKVAQVKRRHGRIDLIMVDHIGLVSSDRRRNSRQEEVADITWALKMLSKRHDCPVLMIAQQNRQYSARKDKTPILADLAESSSIEKDSDMLIGVLSHRDGDLSGWTELHVVGARLGETGMAVAEYKNGRLIPGSLDEFLAAKQRTEGLEQIAQKRGSRGDIN